MKKGIIFALLGAVGAIGAGIAVKRTESKKTARQKEYADKHLAIMQNMNQWLLLKQEGKTLKPYFEENGYKRVAIYGMSYLGERLLDDLKGIGIEVAYAIDKNASALYSEVEIYTPDDELPEVDAIIVTATFYFEKIEEMLAGKVDCPVISLEEILYEG